MCQHAPLVLDQALTLLHMLLKVLVVPKLQAADVVKHVCLVESKQDADSYNWEPTAGNPCPYRLQRRDIQGARGAASSAKNQFIQI